MKRTGAGLLGVFLAMVAVPALAVGLATHPPGFAVSTATTQATAAGVEILKGGGNAFDAAVAVTAALAVTEPYSSGLGGGGFWLLHSAAKGRDVMVDGRETAPLAASATMYQRNGKAIRNLSLFGALAGGIPGEPAAIVYIAKHYGKLGLQRDLTPAIRLAREGFPITPRFHDIAARMAKYLSPAARAVFLPGGKAPPVGYILKQPTLANTLQALARHGRAGFYSGPVAQALVRGVRADGGIWSLQDLARYRVRLRRPTVCYFRAYRVTSTPPPSAGGIGLCEILHQLEARGYTHGGTAHEDAMVIEAMRRAYRDRAAWLGDPDFVDIPVHRLLSMGYADFLARTTDPNHATPSALLPSPAAITGRAPAAPGTVHQPREGDDTSSFSVVDAAGNRVAATITVNIRFGSNYMAPGTGVIINDEMDDFAASVKASNVYGLIGSRANEIAPGKRPLSTMSPTFVSGPNGVLVIGTPGGSRILTMVLLGVLHFANGENVRQIVAAPRYHMQYLPDQVQFEPGAFSAVEQRALQKMGYHLDPLHHRYGDMHAVLWNPRTDRLTAASDPRGVGSATVVLDSNQ
ncbi:MAG TPA: gamma-glutamyltransferase [Nevskiaceae bacterium]|nr:gamma-glutamyltransferase [Nevskiaceae bacterium]